MSPLPELPVNASAYDLAKHDEARADLGEAQRLPEPPRAITVNEQAKRSYTVLGMYEDNGQTWHTVVEARDNIHAAKLAVGDRLRACGWGKSSLDNILVLFVIEGTGLAFADICDENEKGVYGSDVLAIGKEAA